MGVGYYALDLILMWLSTQNSLFARKIEKVAGMQVLAGEVCPIV
jgi:hypothetical protein